MKAVKYCTRGIISVADIPEPQILNPEDVKIKTSYASICGYDMMTVKGEATQPFNGFIGHEASGIVIETGEADKGESQPGERVMVDFFEHCYQCVQCRKGNYSFCLNPSGTANGMSEYLIRNKRQIIKLPENISLKEGCLTEPVTLGIYALSKASSMYGKRVMIIGGGSMGLIMLQLALLNPISFIVIADPHECKRKLALQLGAHAVIDPKKENVLSRSLDLTNGEGFDIVIEASGDIRSTKTAFQILARGGTLIYFALYGMNAELQINLFNLYWKDASIHGVHYPSNLIPAALAIMPRLDLNSVITGIYPIDHAAEAFAAKAAGNHAKVMLEF